MSPADRPAPEPGALRAAQADHIAISVASLSRSAAFYEGLGFQQVQTTDFAPAPVRSTVLVNASGLRIELIEHGRSHGSAVAESPMDAALEQGLGHVALRVDDVDGALEACLASGATTVAAPGLTSRGDAGFAYLADLDGTVIELVGPPAADPPAAGRETDRLRTP
ncbi:VOC family protein [Frondihabitans australicus]|uniref:Catechol 2,3-dioxygenase-like lactoylglutathione lyase family enzyme n=1 Tax=Frondihabitans australicus TaxID=386892 RepID=A0A495IFK6_9MICO|nr:VOC family protein [Frondihabitans australicus]RKR74793.1 catechol 2,3-dioxygenase-like lactoylglutathione lyase family enzyme [Frondihabitans australicus]